MEHIQNIYNLVNHYWLLSILVGMASVFIESFLPVLTLIELVTANAALFGMYPGLIISWIGSVSGTVCLFFIIKKISHLKIIEKLRNEKVEKAIHWIEDRGFKLLFFAYACPFLPACLITISQGLSNRKTSEFISAVFGGKLIMFFVVSYIGKDIIGFITNPLKVLLFAVVVFIAWKIGNKLNEDLDNFEGKRKHENDLDIDI
ncbi:MAG: TVP38/TMEM64 family protein [Romboutsia sp.]|uniref:TVP38/TMEM64 family protein n=1 Tax=Romboutsia sp. TaxID=1965302 RepID=UPI003F337992